LYSELKRVEQNYIAEWSFSSRKRYIDPFNDVEVSAIFTDPDGEEKVVPAEKGILILSMM